MSPWIAGLGTLGAALGAGFADDGRTPGIDSTRAQELLEQRFRQVSGADAQIVFAGDPADVSGAGVKATLEAIGGQPHVTGVSDLQASPDGQVAFATVQYDVPAEELGPAARERLESVTGPAEGSGVEVSMRGLAIDIADEMGAPVGELIGVAAAVLLLTLRFRSVVAMTLTLVAAAFGLAGGMVLIALASAGIDIPTVAPTVAMMLGLGLMAAFRPVIVPLVSAAFNLLSIGAAYGVVTLPSRPRAVPRWSGSPSSRSSGRPAPS